ncbi:MAG: DUF4112 domain-containing protein [Balneolaceae bacterium]|nr:DUF4112 domain-containing protein [Balneolaceae bacterium]
MMNSIKNDKEIHAVLSRLDTFSYYTDSNFRIPFTNVRFGLSPLIGLMPVIGDFAGLILSLYVLYEARKINADKKVQRKIIRNMLIEFIVGLVPVFGDAFDVVYKANTKNTELLRNYLFNELGEVPEWRFPWFTFIWVCLLILLVLITFFWFF